MLWLEIAAGGQGFRSSRKSTPFAAQVAAKKLLVKAAREYELSRMLISWLRSGPGR